MKYEVLQQQLKQLMELKVRLAFDIIYDMSEEEIKTIPHIQLSQQEIDFINRTGIVIGVTEELTVHEYGSGFAILIPKE
jgi:hypothetical protein